MPRKTGGQENIQKYCSQKCAEIQEGDLVIFGEKRFIYKGDEEGFQRVEKVEKEKVYQKVEREECPTEGCTNPKQAMGTCFGCNSKNI